ncbi:unnamed protein product [Sphagnum jensenii]
MVNLLQNVNSEAMERDATITLESASSRTLKVDLEKMSLCDPVATEQTNAPMSDSDTNADDDNDGGFSRWSQLMTSLSSETPSLKNWC